MSTKEKLLVLFESSKGVYFSGEELAQELSLSRTSVWKAVNSLRNEGYNIDAVPNKGYCLSAETDILSCAGIKKYLKNRKMKIDVFPSVGSTNTLAKQKASEGAPDLYAVIAGQQTAGRGRYGRSFFSPDNSGLYMSLVLRPDCWKSDRAFRITTMAAVAMCEAINEISPDQARIKWVNDIFMRDKKICGILTEASFDLESNMLDYAVLGVGVNVYEPTDGFPEELKNIAGSVFVKKQKDAKNRIAGNFLNRFIHYYKSGDISEYTDKYRKLSLAVGKEVTVISAAGQERALVTGVDDECRLLVKFSDGKEKALSYGEISIKI